MMMFMLGLLIGGSLGALGMAMACAAGRADERAEAMQNKINDQ